VIRYVREHPDTPVADVAASFQAAVVDVLVAKAKRAAAEVGAAGICLGGGVAANSLLRERILDLCTADGLRCFLPSRTMCTDNAAMVAAAGWWRYPGRRPDPPRRGRPAEPAPGLSAAPRPCRRLPRAGTPAIVSTRHVRVLTLPFALWRSNRT